MTSKYVQLNVFLILFLSTWWRHEICISKILNFGFVENEKCFWSEIKKKNFFLVSQVLSFRLAEMKETQPLNFIYIYWYHKDIHSVRTTSNGWWECCNFFKIFNFLDNDSKMFFFYWVTFFIRFVYINISTLALRFTYTDILQCLLLVSNCHVSVYLHWCINCHLEICIYWYLTWIISGRCFKSIFCYWVTVAID